MCNHRSYRLLKRRKQPIWYLFTFTAQCTGTSSKVIKWTSHRISSSISKVSESVYIANCAQHATGNKNKKIRLHQVSHIFFATLLTLPPRNRLRWRCGFGLQNSDVSSDPLTSECLHRIENIVRDLASIRLEVAEVTRHDCSWNLIKFS